MERRPNEGASHFTTELASHGYVAIAAGPVLGDETTTYPDSVAADVTPDREPCDPSEPRSRRACRESAPCVRRPRDRVESEPLILEMEADSLWRPATVARAIRTVETMTAQTPSKGSPSISQLAVGFGIAGLLPIPGIIASLAAIVCGSRALKDDSSDHSQARLALWLGALGIAAPLLLLLVYCVVLGYPFPIERYHANP